MGSDINLSEMPEEGKNKDKTPIVKTEAPAVVKPSTSKTANLLNPFLIGAFSLFVPILFFMQADEIEKKDNESKEYARLKDSIQTLRVFDSYKKWKTIDSLCIANDFYARQQKFLENYIYANPRQSSGASGANNLLLDEMIVRLGDLKTDTRNHYNDLDRKLDDGQRYNKNYYENLDKKIQDWQLNNDFNIRGIGTKYDALLKLLDAKIDLINTVDFKARTDDKTTAVNSDQELKQKLNALANRVRALNDNIRNLARLESSYNSLLNPKESSQSINIYTLTQYLSTLEQDIFKNNKIQLNEIPARLSLLHDYIKQEEIEIRTQLEAIAPLPQTNIANPTR